MASADLTAPQDPLAQGRRRRPARRVRQAAAQPDAGLVPDRAAARTPRSPRRSASPEDDVLRRVQELIDARIIRQVTPIYDTRALGYGSMLVAAKVDPEHPWRAAKIINSHPGVSHNYLRNHDFNMWFTIAVEEDSKLGLQGTLDVLQELTGAESIRQLPTLKLFKIRMDLEMEGDTQALASAGVAEEPVELGKQPYDEFDRAVIRATQGDLPVVSEPYADAAGAPRRAGGSGCSTTSPGCRSAACCAASPRSSSTAARASAPTAWACGRSPRTGSPRSARGWPPSAASATATSARPTRTGRTRSSRWPTGAPRRSATRSSTRSPASSTASRTARRSTRSTEFKKIRLLYFTDDFKDWEREHAGV